LDAACVTLNDCLVTCGDPRYDAGTLSDGGLSTCQEDCFARHPAAVVAAMKAMNTCQRTKCNEPVF
jgi:hypothetical protein